MVERKLWGRAEGTSRKQQEIIKAEGRNEDLVESELRGGARSKQYETIEVKGENTQCLGHNKDIGGRRVEQKGRAGSYKSRR